MSGDGRGGGAFLGESGNKQTARNLDEKEFRRRTRGMQPTRNASRLVGMTVQ